MDVSIRWHDVGGAVHAGLLRRLRFLAMTNGGLMYIPRDLSELGPLAKLLGRDGIARVPDIYSVAEIAALNAAMDGFFERKADEARAYVWPDDMVALGIFGAVLSPGMQDVLFSVMPDPVIYHMLASEIAAGNDRSHVFEDAPGGWHRDEDCLYFEHDPTHVSVTVYLSDVGPGDGVFELAPQLPDRALRRETPVVSMTGRAGLSFVWHRSFHHRAAPNAGARRRRIIKFSIQRNDFFSQHLKAGYFRRTLAEIPQGDLRMDMLLGRFQGRQAPLLAPAKLVAPSRVTPAGVLGPVADGLAPRPAMAREGPGPEGPGRKRVLIVGAGRRGQNSFLPCFACLDHLFEVRGLHARSAERLVPVARQWGVAAVTELAGFDLAEVDLVVVSVPTAQNAAVLKALLPHAGRLKVLIDTPIAQNGAEMDAVAPLLQRFAGVTVAEDHMNFPFHSLARRAAGQGVIGRPRSVSLFNTGYMYHGLAIIRALAGFAPVAGSSDVSLGTHAKVVSFTFADGFSGNMIGPYRRQEKVGGLLLEGSLGIISESALDARFIGGKRRMFLLQPVREGGLLAGYRITGEGYELGVELPYLERMRGMAFPDRSEINLVQNCGLIEVILSVFHEENINRGYGYTNGLYDAIASQWAAGGRHELQRLKFL